MQWPATCPRPPLELECAATSLDGDQSLRLHSRLGGRTMRYLIAAVFLICAATSAGAQKNCNITGSSVVCDNGLTGNKTGNTTFFSDGTSSTLSGNSTPSSGGGNSTQSKNGAYNSGTFNSGTYNNGAFNSDGASARPSGATRNYQTCTRSGSALFCN